MLMSERVSDLNDAVDAIEKALKTIGARALVFESIDPDLMAHALTGSERGHIEQLRAVEQAERRCASQVIELRRALMTAVPSEARRVAGELAAAEKERDCLAAERAALDRAIDGVKARADRTASMVRDRRSRELERVEREIAAGIVEARRRIHELTRAGEAVAYVRVAWARR